MREPEIWEPTYRLNTCVECGHYLHDKDCKACTSIGQSCPEGVGRFYQRDRQPTYWWPLVKDLGIPVPLTHILPVDHSAICSAMDGANSLSDEFVAKFREMGKLIGYPLFLRTDLQSGKHGWNKTCYVASENKLIDNMFEVALENEMGACFLGGPYEAFVFREFLELDTSFIAFYGKMPINKERRYFVRDGEVICHHPYWPRDAFIDHTNDGDWESKLAALNYESEEEIIMLSAYARTVGVAMEGCWSVDFAKAKNGKWYLIDMALGHESYHWYGCPHAASVKEFAEQKTNS